MRLLHTGDWHVGKTLARHSRIDETRAVLQEVVEVAAAEGVDGVLVCGDVFDHWSPSPEAEATVYEALLAFERHEIPVVLIAGNHDHPQRWRALVPLFERFGVHVVPEPLRPDAGGIVELKSRDGSHTAQIVALPWVPEKKIVGTEELMGLAEQPYQSYADEMKRILDALCRGFDPSKCNLLAAHLFVSGSVISGSERALTIGDLYAVTPQAIPVSAQYVALGHVHKPQRVRGVAVPARYSGSLLQLDFGEVDQAKSVAIVDLAPGGPAEVREVQLKAGRKLLDVAGTLEELAQYSDTADEAFLRVTLVCQGPQAGLGDAVRELLPNALVVKLDYPRVEAARETIDIREIAPRELFERFFRVRHAADPEPELLDLFDALLDEVTAP